MVQTLTDIAQTVQQEAPRGIASIVTALDNDRAVAEVAFITLGRIISGNSVVPEAAASIAELLSRLQAVRRGSKLLCQTLSGQENEQLKLSAIQAFGVELVLPPDHKRGQQDQLAEMLSTVLVLDKLSQQVLSGQVSHNSKEQSSDSHSPKSDENMARLKTSTDELAEQEMDPNPWLDPMMPSLLSMLRTKFRTLSRDLHVPEPAPRDRCSNFDQFQASIALKVAADTNSMGAQQNVSRASSAQIPFGDTHNVTSAKEQTSSHTALAQSAWEDVQVVVTRLLVALDWLQQQPSSPSASTAEPSQHALLHEALVSLIHKLLSEHLKDPMLDMQKLQKAPFSHQLKNTLEELRQHLAAQLTAVACFANLLRAERVNNAALARNPHCRAAKDAGIFKCFHDAVRQAAEESSTWHTEVCVALTRTLLDSCLLAAVFPPAFAKGLNKALVHALAIALKNERSPQPEQVQHLPGGFAQSTMFRDEDWVYFIEHGLSHVMRYLIKHMKLEMISYRCPPETACPGDDLQCYVSTCTHFMTGLTGRLKEKKGDVSQPPAPEASAGYSPADMPLYKQATAAMQRLFVLVDRLKAEVLDRPLQAARTKTPWPDTAPKVLSAVASQAKECIKTALGQLQELHKVEAWMAILAELQHEGWCEDKSAPACLKEDLVYLQKRRALPAKSIQAIYDCFFGLPVTEKQSTSPVSEPQQQETSNEEEQSQA
ncbi:TPA: hypothetical protein ACH3X3_003033 [Trebouxia sp. C0006]